MTNTSSFDKELLNDTWSNGKRRATSFDLVLYRIPFKSDINSTTQEWDEGVGYDYYQGSSSSSSAMSVKDSLSTDKSFSDRASNWYERSLNIDWGQEGIYDNTNSQSTDITSNYDNLHIIGTQHFSNGNEDIEFDMTDEINSLLNGEIEGFAGWGISFKPELENITGLTENYSVGFFSKYTQTFYEPFLETTYDDLIDDNRNNFYNVKSNNLYLYSYSNGKPVNFDENPIVDLLDINGQVFSNYNNLPTCKVTDGVYKVVIEGLTYSSIPCMITDRWKNIRINGIELDDVYNEFVLHSLNDFYQIGINNNSPSLYGFDFYGIKQDEKILNTDIRKVGVVLKEAYTTNNVLNDVECYYKVYVKEGETEVQVQEWTKVNKTPDQYYFIFDTRDKIPNEYFVDIKVITDREVNTYKRELKFQIVNKK